MTSLKCKGSAFWLLLLSINFSSCEFDSPTTEIKVDYTGQKGTVKDFDNNIYHTIGIGSQIWMAENLATTRLNNGALLSNIKSDSIWSLPGNKQPAYCMYNNDSIHYKSTYGLLYNYYAVKTGALCPVGWHVPLKADWDTLILFAGGSTKAGGKLKDMESSWIGPNYGLSENYEFNAVPGGRRVAPGGYFFELGLAAYWWASDSVNFIQSNAYFIQNKNTNMNGIEAHQREGFNIRCIKNK